ncbi:uncharacterized protein SPAPADRAFT_149805 [Spathaspora passalidarum NRRL Y-27907]|uniref:Protein kinase domain-containing protein n=1 Tax=Spathaspora passalidarum (strain NRRL Y-27907 / 11-Y1) TaxID=619300 RepID=G3ALV3_SPAPN|nr:uncharacterized protein SPAPADRAFT_149805 [Spathaspora passalidarum NRRL Y-27907]EGW32712.1 hypothetical protein SPAPADRAFT_149805 [Spathaspora passalidarum NRRL Y-27907]
MGNFPKLPEGTKLQVGSHKVTVIEYLSEGGFAHIYKVSIDPIEEDSNIACLKRVILKDKSGLNNMRREVDVMKTLRHARNIVRYYDSHAERLPDGTYQVLVLMELCPNKSLLDYMNVHIKTKLKEFEILNIILDISQGIYGMHQLKLIHRDIKIENVLIDSKHRFKLCDFGSTTGPVMPPHDQQQFNFISHDILYHTTPQYRAPEMIDLYRGFPIDEKADIWALGCFLYKLCYYTTPFEAQGDIAILHASFQFLPEPHYSGDLKNLIIIMLQENPMFRPNIVQVLMLISKMMGFEFKSLGLEDIYKLGPYNFQALHDFQVHKQNEYMRQKQAYYQQQLIASSRNQSNVIPPTASATLEIPAIKKETSRSSSAGSRLSQVVQPEKEEEEEEEELDGSFIEDLEDAEEKYPSLDELDKTELEGAEQRYPALDDLIKAGNTKGESSPNLELSPKKSTLKPVKPDEPAKAKPSLDVDLLDLSDKPMQQEATPEPAEFTSPISLKSSKRINPFPFPTTDMSAIDSVQSDISISTPGRNPWGDYRVGDIPSQHPSKNSAVLTNPPTENIIPEHHPLEGVAQSKLHSEIIEPNLIDLEVGLNSSNSSSSVSLLNTQSQQQPNDDPSQVSLIDLEIEEQKVNAGALPGAAAAAAVAVSGEPKPQFKKRINSIQSSSRLSFQEEIIDFESDDENNESYMNRLNIRKSLKKSRKTSDHGRRSAELVRRSGEHKRSESLVSETRKRLSFFGGN